MEPQFAADHHAVHGRGWLRDVFVFRESACGINAQFPVGIHGGGEGKRTWTGLSFQLDDLRAGITKLKECGGSLTSEPNDTPEDPLHLAMCLDPEGNEFMMTQRR